jgi:3-Oxoacyl-[acyl-carrier-protein (ACP)] synthase III C terminal
MPISRTRVARAHGLTKNELRLHHGRSWGGGGANVGSSKGHSSRPPQRHWCRLRVVLSNDIAANLLATAAGLAPEKLNFNIGKVGNTSAASIPIAIADAIRGGIIRQPSRIFTPGFGAGAVAGYAVMRIDPRIVAARPHEPALPPATAVHGASAGSSIEDVRAAFAE